MLVFTQNVKSNPLMRQGWVEDDILSALPHGGIGFWQEFEPARYKRALHTIAQRRRRVVCGHVECPVTVNGQTWPVDEVEVRLMHKGRPLASPNRYATIVRSHRGRKKVAFIATHMVSGAWNIKRKLFKKWRRRMWEHHHLMLSAIVHELRAQGYTVVIGGDFNRLVHTMPEFHREQIVAAAAGIDGIIVIPAEGWHVETEHVGTYRKGLHTDHPTVVARVGIKKAA